MTDLIRSSETSTEVVDTSLDQVRPTWQEVKGSSAARPVFYVSSNSTTTPALGDYQPVAFPFDQTAGYSSTRRAVHFFLSVVLAIHAGIILWCVMSPKNGTDYRIRTIKIVAGILLAVTILMAIAALLRPLTHAFPTAETDF